MVAGAVLVGLETIKDGSTSLPFSFRPCALLLLMLGIRIESDMLLAYLPCRNIISSIGSSSASTQVGARTALDQMFDRRVADELEGIDDPLDDEFIGTGKAGTAGSSQRKVGTLLLPLPSPSSN